MVNSIWILGFDKNRGGGGGGGGGGIDYWKLKIN